MSAEVRDALKSSNRETRILFLHLQTEMERLFANRQAVIDAALKEAIGALVEEKVAETSGKILETLNKERDGLERERQVVLTNISALRQERRELEALMDELKKYGINVLRTKR
jgi:hypothetical protein